MAVSCSVSAASGEQSGLFADFTTLTDAFGAQLDQLSTDLTGEFPTPDSVGFAGEWGCYTDSETAPIRWATRSW